MSAEELRELDAWIAASDYRSALHFMNTIKASLGLLKCEQLPLYVHVGQSCFKITQENFDAVAFGVLMAAEWPKPKDEE